MSTSIGETLLNSIRETDTLTWIGTVTAVLYVILALKESIWCWSFGIVSSALWVSIYFHQELWYESMLNVFYVVLGIFGWIQWARSSASLTTSSTPLTTSSTPLTTSSTPLTTNPASLTTGSASSSTTPEIKITRIPGKTLLNAVLIAVVSGIILGYIANAVTKNDFAYTDALLSSFAVIATWMTAKKYLENWLFWIAIDACSAVLYIFKGPEMYLAALLFIFYTFMAIGGYFTWKKSLKA